jgi:VCBS repeat-containing protein
MLRQIIIFVVLLLPVGITGCLFDSPQSYNHSDVDQMSFERETGDFTSVKLEGNYHVRLENSETSSVEINAGEELKELILVDIKNGVLTVKTLEKRSFDNRKQAELIIKAPTIEYIKIEESAIIVSEQPFRFDELSIESAGALKMDIELIGNQFVGEMAGATDLKLRGKVTQVKLNIPGAGNVSAFDLHTDEMDLSLSGAGKAEVFADKRLNVDVAGACIVTYKGSPDEVFTNISGIGRVREAR